MKALVVEDSRLAREGLMSLLSEYDDIELIGNAGHPDTALSMLENRTVDVLFLDIHMPGSTGFDLLEKLQFSPFVIFTTAYSEHAIRSFDFNTIDYLLKPIHPRRLEQAIIKLRKHYALMTSSCDATDREYGLPYTPGDDHEQILDINSRMFIKDNGQCHLVDLKAIRYFESCKNYARLYFNDNNAFIKTSMNALEKRLPAQYFFRVNRQHIVNLHAATCMDETDSGSCCLVLDDGKRVEVSRRQLARLKAALSFSK